MRCCWYAAKPTFKSTSSHSHSPLPLLLFTAYFHNAYMSTRAVLYEHTYGHVIMNTRMVMYEHTYGPEWTHVWSCMNTRTVLNEHTYGHVWTHVWSCMNTRTVLYEHRSRYCHRRGKLTLETITSLVLLVSRCVGRKPTRRHEKCV